MQPSRSKRNNEQSGPGEMTLEKLLELFENEEKGLQYYLRDYQPKPDPLPVQASPVDLSNFDELTQDFRSYESQANDGLFEPSEITGRSTCHVGLTSQSSTEDILSKSCAEDVRRLAVGLSAMKVRQSYGGRTADMSRDSSVASGSTRPSSKAANPWADGFKRNAGEMGGGVPSDMEGASFRSTNLSEFMANEERDWNDEFGSLPSSAPTTTKTSIASGNVRHRNLDETDFSSSPQNNNPNSLSGVSIGRYFSGRSDNIADLLASARKSAQPRETEKSLYTDSQLDVLYKELSMDKPASSQPEVNNQTFSPPTCEKVDSTPGDAEPNNPPLEDVLFVTKPLPLSEKGARSDNVNILKFEELQGNIAQILKTLIDNTHAATERHRQTDLTPGRRHIVSKQQNKENEGALSDTVSYTESMLDSSYNEMIMSRDSLDNVVPLGNQDSSTRKRHRQSSVTNDENMYETPPRGTAQPPVVEKVTVFQSKSRLNPPPQRSDSDELDTANGQRPSVVVEELVDSRCTSPTSSKNSPTSTTFSSPGFSSSKSESRPAQHEERQQHPLTRCNLQSQLGSTSDLQSSRNDCVFKASCEDVFWGSTKLRKTVNKTFTVKNMSDKRLSLNMEVAGPGFQIFGTNGISVLTLQGQECRTIMISFCPTMIGPAVGKVMFIDVLSMCAVLNLYGFGGNSAIQVTGTTRGPIGKSFICFGELRDIQQRNSSKQWFTITNQGVLPGVVIITVKATTREGKLQDLSSVSVYPSKFILPPESQRQVCVQFEPKRTELRRLERQKGDVSTVATLDIVYGDEPNRQRIVRLLDILKQESNAYEALEKLLCVDFPDQQQMEVNFEDFNESTSNMSELFTKFKSEEIDLTVNHPKMHETVANESFMSNDDTILFKTLRCVALEQRMGSSLQLSDSRMQAGQQQQHGGARYNPPARQWSVKPTFLEMNTNESGGTSRYIIITNNMSSTQSFEVFADKEQLFEIRPNSGQLHAGEKIPVSLRLLKRNVPYLKLCVSVYFENDKIDVTVEVNRCDGRR